MRKKNLITVLKKLVASFGGEGKGNNAVDLVDEFADAAAESGASLFKSAIENGGIGYSEPKILIKDAKSPAFDQENPESVFITVSPAVIELVPREELTLHVSIPEYNVDEDVTAAVIEQQFYPGSSIVPMWACLNFNEQELYGYQVFILNDYDDQGVLRGNKFACIYITSSDGTTEEYHLPVFSISMPGYMHKISPDMIAGQLLPETTASDNGKMLGVSNGVWDKVDAQSWGTDVFSIKITDKKDDSDNTCTANHTQAEIKAAYTAGNIMKVTVQRYAGTNNKRYFIDGYMKWASNVPYVFVVDRELIDGTYYLVFLMYYNFGTAVGSAVTRTAYKVAVSTY